LENIMHRRQLLASLLLPLLLAGSAAAHKPPPRDVDRGAPIDPDEEVNGPRRRVEVDQPPQPVNLPPANAAAEASNELAMDLYRDLATRNAGQNMIFSPASISLALAMTYGGAAGTTADQMAQVLHLDATGGGGKASAAYGALLKALAAEGAKKGTELHVADHLWVEKRFPFSKAYLQATAKAFGAGVESTDFNKKYEAARKTINAWVAKQTANRIKDLLPDGSLTEDSRIVLVNAIYFKGTWKYAFSKKETVDGDFATASGSNVTAKFMTREKLNLKYAQATGVTMVELPYASGDLAMDIILPDDAKDLPNIESNLSADLGSLLSFLAPTEDMTVTIPRFTMTIATPLNDTLVALGMSSAFDQNSADFSAMIDQKKAKADDRLYLSAVYHKAFIAVDESGSEAAAATAVVGAVPTSVEIKPVFRADHPFVYVIRDTKTGAILFIGRVLDPTQT
jgi:serpin B